MKCVNESAKKFLMWYNMKQHIVICKVTLPSLWLWASFHPLSYSQSKDILLNFNMKCWNLTFNTQGLRLTIVVV